MGRLDTSGMKRDPATWFARITSSSRRTILVVYGRQTLVSGYEYLTLVLAGAPRALGTRTNYQVERPPDAGIYYYYYYSKSVKTKFTVCSLVDLSTSGQGIHALRFDLGRLAHGTATPRTQTTQVHEVSPGTSEHGLLLQDTSFLV